MILINKILSTNIISIICASNIFAQNDSIILSHHNAYCDSTMATNANITFSKIPTENYGFDYWRGNDYDKAKYPSYNGYTILDMGDFNNKGFSIFYAMEKSVIFK